MKKSLPFLLLLLLPTLLLGEESKDALSFRAGDAPPLMLQAIMLSAMALLPFVLMLVTPFAKIVMVFSLLRNALGVQQVPPNQVINGISLILSVFIMFPVGIKMFEAAQPILDQHKAINLTSKEAPEFFFKLAYEAKEPLRSYLQQNSLTSHQKNFFKISFKMLPEEYRPKLRLDHFIILIPSFITSQVKNGFEIGVMIYLPFFVVDLVVSNILLAMGMMMLSPVTISMPLKLFLLVMLDGWTLLTEGLIFTFKI